MQTRSRHPSSVAGYNVGHASYGVVSIIRGLVAGGDVAAEEIFALSPYKPQVHRLSAKLNRKGMGKVIAQTVDRSQGDENAVVVLSTVRCNPRGSYGFVGDERRLNVAMTRAKLGLIIVGDERTLAFVDANNVWTPLFREFGKRGLIVDRDASVTISTDRRKQVDKSASGEVIKKTVTFSGLNSRSVALNKSDAEDVLNNARSIARSLMSTSLFRFYLHYCLALHPHKYRIKNYPSDIRLYDRKMWSNIAAFHRCNIPADASNYVYWNCVVLLVAVEKTIDNRWKELLQYVCMLPLPDGNDLHTYLGEKKANQFLSDAGDIYEAIAGFCMSNTVDSGCLRALFERDQGGEDLEFHSRTILSQMAKLAECIYLLVRGCSWSESRMHSLLTNNQSPRVKSGDAEPSVSWKSHDWVAVFWPELCSISNTESKCDDPDFEESGQKTKSAQMFDNGLEIG